MLSNSKAELFYNLKAARIGNNDAFFDLGKLYKEGGKDFAANYAEAAKYFQAAAKSGMTEAEYQMGEIYYLGYAVFKRDFVTASKWYRRAAEAGNTRAQYNMGYFYQHGLGVKYDWESAVKWFKKAAEKGHILSQVNLADLCAQMDRQRYEDAIYWYIKAAEQDSGDAHCKLGDIYFFGLGCEVDQVEAINHYRIAAEEQDYVAQFRLEDGSVL